MITASQHLRNPKIILSNLRLFFSFPFCIKLFQVLLHK
jgi:hypothetical protein